VAGKAPEWNEEYSQTLLERQIREQCEIHGWATISTANPLDILILEEEEDDYNIKKRAIS